MTLFVVFSALLSALAAVGTTVITGIYAWLTYGLVQSSRETVRVAYAQIIELSRPVILFKIQSRPGSQIFQLAISNVGKSAARNLSLHINPDVITFHGRTARPRSLQETRLFRERIDSFPAGSEILIDLGIAGDFFSEDAELAKKAPPQFVLTAHYEDSHAAYQETTPVDLEIFRPATASQYGVLAELHKVNETLEKLVTHLRRD